MSDKIEVKPGSVFDFKLKVGDPENDSTLQIVYEKIPLYDGKPSEVNINEIQKIINQKKLANSIANNFEEHQKTKLANSVANNSESVTTDPTIETVYTPNDGNVNGVNPMHANNPQINNPQKKVTGTIKRVSIQGGKSNKKRQMKRTRKTRRNARQSKRTK